MRRSSAGTRPSMGKWAARRGRRPKTVRLEHAFACCTHAHESESLHLANRYPYSIVQLYAALTVSRSPTVCTIQVLCICIIPVCLPASITTGTRQARERLLRYTAKLGSYYTATTYSCIDVELSS